MSTPMEKSLGGCPPEDEQEANASPSGVVRGNLAQFFAKSPLAGSGIEVERPRDFGRDLEL
jgi:hypothetical protein